MFNMKKIYKVPVFKVEGVSPCNFIFIDDIIVSKSRFGYKELFTRYSIKCIDSQYNEIGDNTRVVIFKKDLNDDNFVDSDDFIDFFASVPSSKWKTFYDENLKKYNNGDNPDNKVLRKYKEFLDNK